MFKHVMEIVFAIAVIDSINLFVSFVQAQTPSTAGLAGDTLGATPFDPASHDITEKSQRCYDFKWAEQFHAMVDAVESKDEAKFSRVSELLGNDRSADTVAESYGRDLLLAALQDCMDAMSTVALTRLRVAWNKRMDATWDADILFAMNDLLERLFDDSPEKRSLQQDIRLDLAKRLSKMEKAFKQSEVSRSELSKFAFRQIRRLPDDEVAVRECDRLLNILNEDFGLTSIQIERLSSLHTSTPEKWREKYQKTLRLGELKLTTDQRLRIQFPTALPKILFELSQFQSVATGKISLLAQLLKACDEASTLLKPNEDLSSGQQLLNENTLKELRASALLDGYRTFKKSADADIGTEIEAYRQTFAASIVVEALKAMTEIHREDNKALRKFLNTQLAQAGVLFDMVRSRFLVALDDTEWLATEKQFQQVLDDELKRSFREIELEKSSFEKEMEASLELELAWIQWRMKKVNIRLRNLGLAPTEFRAELPGIRRDLITRLKQLKEDIHASRKDDVLTALGYLHLTYGDYQKAIDELENTVQNKQFAAHVIRCLAHKDSGNFGEAEIALAAIDKPEPESSEELIILFLESELAVAQDKVSSTSISNLREKLKEPRLSAAVSEQMLKLNNEHHQALELSKYDSGNVSAESLDRALDIWKLHLPYEGTEKSFIRARALYSLASALLRQDSDKRKVSTDALAKTTQAYKKELDVYEEASVKTKEQYKGLLQQHEEITKLREEMAANEHCNNEAYTYCVKAMKEVRNLRVPKAEGEYRYPNLVYNILCLAMRVQLLSPANEDFGSQLNDVDPELKGLKEISVEARKIALKQRKKLSKNGDFDENRNALFERYRDAFDLTVEMAASGSVDDLTISDVAFVGAETTNQTIAELFDQSEANELNSISADRLQGRQFISFFVGSQATHVFWRIANQEIRHHRVDISRSEVAAAVHDYLKYYLAQPSLKDPQEALKLQRKLLPIQLRDALANTPQNQCVYVIPHGPLFQIPLDTLPIDSAPDTRTYLIDRCPPLIYLPTLARSNDTQVETVARHRALLTVQPDSTIGTESEALMERFGVANVMRIGPTGIPEATELPGESRNVRFDSKKLLDELTRGYRFIHFGSHGAIQDTGQSGVINVDGGVKVADQGIESGRKSAPYLGGAYLQLWKLDEVSNDDHFVRRPTSSGMFEVFEIMWAADVLKKFQAKNGLRLPSELVLLSACETQVVDTEAIRYGGNTIKAMGTAFLVAGAENIIASHWRVNDLSTTPLITDFMCAVKQRPELKLSAEDYARILHAQRKKLSQDNRFRAPYDWGPFTLSTTLQ